MANADGHVVDQERLPADYPTHRHSAVFWEELGRTLATFGFLEETLGKAIFALTATRRYDDADLASAYENWLPTLEKAVSDPLGRRIDLYGRAMKDHSDLRFQGHTELVSDLRSASALRNVLCHGSWGVPDNQGRSVPFFVTQKMMIFETSIDVEYLRQTRSHVVELICEVVSSVTHMGWQFPGSNSPGEVIMKSA